MQLLQENPGLAWNNSAQLSVCAMQMKCTGLYTAQSEVCVAFARFNNTMIPDL